MCAGDKEMWEGMFQMEADDLEEVGALRERLRKHREKGGKKKKDKKEINVGMGLQLLFGGEGWRVRVVVKGGS